MKLKFTEEGLKRGTVVKPGWYVLDIKNIEEKPAGSDAKRPGSMNWSVELSIVGGDFNGVPLYKTFNEYGDGFAAPYFKSLGVNVAAGVEVDFHATKGKRLRGYVKNRLYNNNMINDVVDFMPLNVNPPASTS